LRIFDVFPFWKELDLLELHLEEIGDLVDRIVLVESSYTYTCGPKPLYFAGNRSRFARWLPKIEHVVVDDLGPLRTGWNQNWSHEIYQRNHITDGLVRSGARDDDAVLILDVDEIPSRKTIETVRNVATAGLLRERPLFLRTRLHYYYLDCVTAGPNDWYRACACSYGWLKKREPHFARVDDFAIHSNRFIDHAGWHFSYLGDAAFISEKIQTTTHTEFNIPSLRDVEQIERRRRSGEDVLGRAFGCRFIPFDDSFPETVKSDPAKYAKLGWFRNPPEIS
jgi:hypothetical protein